MQGKAKQGKAGQVTGERGRAGQGGAACRCSGYSVHRRTNELTDRWYSIKLIIIGRRNTINSGELFPGSPASDCLKASIICHNYYTIKSTVTDPRAELLAHFAFLELHD